MNLILGSHLTPNFVEGYESFASQAIKIGANTFQFFTRYTTGKFITSITPEIISAFKKDSDIHGFKVLLAHSGYTANICSIYPKIKEASMKSMREDLKILRELPNCMYNIHPGKHLGQGKKSGIEIISSRLNELLADDIETTILLETQPGKTTEVGKTFGEITSIIKKIDRKEKIGVTLNTCHVYSAGYDIVRHLDKVLGEFDKIIGLERLKAIQLNDSASSLNSICPLRQRIFGRRLLHKNHQSPIA